MKRNITNFSQLVTLALAASQEMNSNRYVGATGATSLQVVGPGYTGQGDESLKMMGTVQNFAQEGHVNRRFGFSITNNADVARTVRLFAGYNTGDTVAAPGQLKDGAFNDVTGAPGLVASATNPRKPINGFLNYVLYNPTRILQMRINCATKAQFSQEISVGSLDPFVDTTSYPINPGLAFDGSTFDPTVADVNTNGLQIDDKSDVLFTILGGATVNFILFAGASYDMSQALAVKAAVAQSNLSGY
jgi:hypothetical protein